MSNPKGVLWDVHGRQMTLRGAARRYGIPYGTLHNRIRSKGLTLEEAVDMTPNPRPRKRPNTETTAQKILLDAVGDLPVRQEGDTWIAEGCLHLYRWILTPDREGFTLTAVFLPLGTASGAPRHYDLYGAERFDLSRAFPGYTIKGGT